MVCGRLDVIAGGERGCVVVVGEGEGEGLDASSPASVSVLSLFSPSDILFGGRPVINSENGESVSVWLALQTWLTDSLRSTIRRIRK